MPLAIGLVALVGFGSIWIAMETSDGPASTVRWFVSESALVLAILVPAVCLFFVIRAVHIRRHEAREAARPTTPGIRQGSELLWSLSNGLLPQTTKSLEIPTDATELVFIAESALVARHSQLAPGKRTLLSAARGLVLPPGRSSGHPARGWRPGRDAKIAATDRRFLVRHTDELIDVPYADITAVHLIPGAVVLRVRDGAPLLVVSEHAESVAVLMVWGSAGEAALKRHPDFAVLRA